MIAEWITGKTKRPCKSVILYGRDNRSLLKLIQYIVEQPNESHDLLIYSIDQLPPVTSDRERAVVH